MPRFIAAILLILSTLLPAQAGDIKGTMELRGNPIGGSTLVPLTPRGMLTIGGVTGGNKADPASRNCYGSTRCKESGSYYSEQGVMQYHNGDPVLRRKPSRPLTGPQPSGAAAPPQLTQQHYHYCSNRYRSYRSADNSYQPFNGARRSCTSPF